MHKETQRVHAGTHAFVADLFRSFGIEHAADLIADLTQALDGNNAPLPP